MADVSYRQDSAPKGGYPEIDFRRHLPRRGPSGLVVMLGGIAAMGVGFFFVIRSNRERKYTSVPLQLLLHIYLS